MNSYLWRLFRTDRDNPTIPCILTWAIIARIDEAARQYVGGTPHARIVNRPLDRSQLLAALERLIGASSIYSDHKKVRNISKIRKAIPAPERISSFKPRYIEISDIEALTSSESVEAIATVTCSDWLFNILESNEKFARAFFDSSMTEIVFAQNQSRSRRLDRLTTFFHRNVVKFVKHTFESRLDDEELRKVLSRARMSGIPSTIAGHVVPGSEEDFLSRICYVVFALERRICPGIAQVFPVQFSAWSLAHICVATSDRDGMSSNLFVVGRQSRGIGTHHLGGDTRVVRDAIFTFVPRRLPDDPDEQARPLSGAAYISSEDRMGYWAIGLPAPANDSVSAEDAPVWWEYTGRSARDDMKLFFFSQHVEPRSQLEASAEPRIFNAIILGHIRDVKLGHLPGIWIALVKRVKNYTVVSRHDEARQSGFWRDVASTKNDVADIIFTSECLSFHGKLDEMTEFFHHCELAGRIEDQANTEDAINAAVNATYGFGKDISVGRIKFPMQLAASLFIMADDDPTYHLINDVFFSRKTLQ